MRKCYLLVLFLYSTLVTQAASDIDVLSSYMEPYTGVSAYTLEFTTYMGDADNHAGGDSISVSISQKGDSVYINQGSFEILKDGTYLIFVNHLLKTIYYAPLTNRKKAEAFSNPIGMFQELMKDTISLQREQQGPLQVFTLNFDAGRPKVYFNKIQLFFNTTGGLVRGVYFQSGENKVVTYEYGDFLTGEAVDVTQFDSARFMSGGQVSPNYSAYTLEKM